MCYVSLFYTQWFVFCEQMYAVPFYGTQCMAFVRHGHLEFKILNFGQIILSELLSYLLYQILS